MAKLSSDKTYVIVERGDTLSAIALKYLGAASKYKQLAAINNISNPNLIYVNQKIYLTKTSGSGSSSSTGNSSVVTITQFGLQSNTDNTIFAVWTWSKDNTENYQTMWYYDTGDGHWFVGNDSTTEHKESTYNISSNAKRVKFKVKPISKKYTVNQKETSYWTASWSTEKIFNTKTIPPETPSSAPTVEIDKYTLTASIDNIPTGIASVQFQVVKNDSSVFKTGTSLVKTQTASYSCAVDAGQEYKVRYRTFRDNLYSDWSPYSSNVRAIPSTPSGITAIRAASESSVYLEWSSVKTATSYDIEYATKKRYFDGSDQTTTKTGVEFTHYELGGLEPGTEYFCRVRAVNEKGSSGWSEIKSVVIGKAPAAPTTWSSTTTVITGEPLTLYWVHNAEDGSSQTFADLEITVDGIKNTYTIKNTEDENEKDKTSSYVMDTSSCIEGVKIQWRVRTAGITKTYGDWSIQRTIDVYAPPTLELTVTDKQGNEITELNGFPWYISGLAGPNTQKPIGYHVVVTANTAYETIDQVGHRKTINEGEQVYSKYFNTSDALLLEMTASSIDLENNISYTLTCVLSMNSGLTARASTQFSVAWVDQQYLPNAEIIYDEELFVTHIRPYCERTVISRKRVNHTSEQYIVSSDSLDGVYGEVISEAKTTTGEQVYYGTTDEGTELYFCEVVTRSLVDDITLSVYRREFDGTFTELATGLINTKNTFITDPHPALDYARYRVVAITNSTGAVSYYDLPGYPIKESAIIIQWNEDWSEFDTTNADSLEKKPWSGSLLRLPYNIDVAEKNSPDVSLVEYVGRKHPVSYYGTQLGEAQNWKTEIPAKDIDTLYALRRLKAWMGDVYVREPSGSGYWANITVSFSQTHRELTIPITIEVTRVEGGV